MSSKAKIPIEFSPHKSESISLLSSESSSANYRGFLNLGGIILVVVNFRLIIENQHKYGVLLTLPTADVLVHNFMNLYCVGTGLFIIYPLMILGYFVELKFLARAPQMMVSAVQWLILLAILTIAPLVVYVFKVPYFSGSLFLGFTCILSMKLYSFSDIMKDVRALSKEKTAEGDHHHIAKKFPDVLRLSDFIIFLFYPTLCFQFVYPRTERIRKIWLLKRIIEWAVSGIMMIVIVNQYIVPLVNNTIPVIEAENINFLKLLERHLKLSIPNMYLWLILFYNSFQCFFNIMGEITRFADRTFYKDWWNSRTMGEYWRLWNLPVHHFLFRHIFIPLNNRGFKKEVCLFIVFTVSAVFHEYMVSGVCRILSYWAFLAMMSQIPIIIVMDLFKSVLEKTQIGNCFFWVSFCIIGQPLAVLIYTYQVMKSLESN